MRTKADFKALRELLGMSQQLLADLLNVRVLSVKRWENPGYDWEAPEEAWKILDEYRAKQIEIIESAIDKAHELEEITGGGQSPTTIHLTYWHNEEEYEDAHPGEGRFWQMANANSRLLSYLLYMDYFNIEFDFPGIRRV